MYLILRNTHLTLSMLVTPFLAIYAVSAFFFAHGALNPSVEVKNDSLITLSARPTDPLDVLRMLEAEHDIYGRILQVETEKGGRFRLTIARSGKRYELLSKSTSREVEMSEFTPNFGGFIQELHLTAGLTDKKGAEKLWGMVLLAVAGAIAVIVVTGFLLWLRRTAEKRTGALFLFSSLAYCGVVLTMIRIG